MISPKRPVCGKTISGLFLMCQFFRFPVTGKLSERVRTPPGPSSVQFDNAAYTSLADVSPPSPGTRKKRNAPVVGFRLNSKDDDENEAAEEDDTIDLAYLEDIVNAIAELEVEKESKTLDITKLNRARVNTVFASLHGKGALVLKLLF